MEENNEIMAIKEEEIKFYNVSQMEKDELKKWCKKRNIDYEKSSLDKRIEWAIEKVDEYLQTHLREDTVHIRRLHYWLGSREPLYPVQIISRRRGKIAEFIDNHGVGWRTYQLDLKHNNRLGEALTEARYRRLIDWRKIIDNRNPELKHDWYQENQFIESNYGIDDDFYINTKNSPTIRDLRIKSWDVPDNPLKIFYESYQGHNIESIENFDYLEYLRNFRSNITFSEGRNNLNMYYIVFTIEKSTLEKQFSELCEKYAIDFFPGQGFASTTRIFEISEKAKDTGKPLLILYLADLDKQGKAMSKSMRVNINRAYPHLHNKVIRIGINDDHLIKYRYLPKETFDGKKKTELDALDSNDMLQLVEDAFIKYTKYARKSRKIRNNRIGYGIRYNIKKSMKKRMENIDSIINSDELEYYKEDMENWIEKYNHIKQDEQKLKKQFSKYIWNPVEKKLKEIIASYNKYLDSFNELNLENPDGETLEKIQKNIENEFSDLFDNQVKKFHIKKVI